jgi:putative tricarboxylic transport membrane protein
MARNATWQRSARLLTAVAATVLMSAAPAALAQGTWRPAKAVELIAASAAGWGTDTTARLIQKVLQERRLVEVPVNVVNKPGGGGSVALIYLQQHAGDAHYLEVASAVLLTNHIAGRSIFNHNDFTPIALLNSEYVVLAVKADAPLRSVKDVIARLKQDTGALSVAVGTSLGGVNHIAMAGVARAAGADARKLKTVVFKSSAESAVAALGGHVDVMASSASLVLPHVRSGAMRILAIASPKRLGGALASAPTLREQGIDTAVDNFRLLIGPSGLNASQIAYWDEVIGRLARSDEWKKDLEANLWENTYMNSRDTRKYLNDEYADMKQALIELGLAK